MSDRPIETAETARMVEEYVRTELRDAAKYTNRQPLDQGGIYSLHSLAAKIYQAGFNDGRMTEATVWDAERARIRDAASA